MDDDNLTDALQAEQELCRRVQDGGTTGRRDIHDLGKLIIHLSTKVDGEIDRAPPMDKQRYSSTLLDFIGATNLCDAAELSRVRLMISAKIDAEKTN